MKYTTTYTCWQCLQYNSLKHPKALCSILLNKPDVLICFGGAPKSRFKRLRHHSCNRWGACYFCESSSWHEMKQKTLTDRWPGGKVAVEARHSGRGLRALCCLKTTRATVGQVSWEGSVPVWCTLMALKHTRTHTEAPGSWGRNREYGRWRASQLDLEHSALASLLSLHNSWCHCSQPPLPTFIADLYFWPPVSLPPAPSPCRLPSKLASPSCHHPL